MNNPHAIFTEEVSDHPILFECYVSLIEKMGDVIWAEYGGGSGYDYNRAKLVSNHWEDIQKSTMKIFKLKIEELNRKTEGVYE